jgi:5'-deoxynucleotidase YfbR-like HD superfamily hydrolase
MRLMSPTEIFIELACCPRRGWVMRDMPEPEDTYSHSLEMKQLVHELARKLPYKVDVALAQELCMAHDLTDYCKTDITPADGVAAKDKVAHEKLGIRFMMATVSDRAVADQMAHLWRMALINKCPEARLVYQLDRLQMGVKTLAYEQVTGHNMEDMWRGTKERQHDTALLDYYHYLYAQRPKGISAEPQHLLRKISAEEEQAAKEASKARLTTERIVAIQAERAEAFAQYPYVTGVKAAAQSYLWRTRLGALTY